MITVAHYSRIEDAVREAEHLANYEIDAYISSGGYEIVPGTAPRIQLQIHPKDATKFKALGAEFEQELEEDNPYQCPKCSSKDYKSYVSPLDFIKGLFATIFFQRLLTRSRDKDLKYQCKKCKTYFRVDI